MRAALLLLALAFAPPALADVPSFDDRHLAVEPDGTVRQGLVPISTERVVALLETSHAADGLLATAHQRQGEWVRDLQAAGVGLGLVAMSLFPAVALPGVQLPQGATTALGLAGAAGGVVIVFGVAGSLVHRGQPLLTREELAEAVAAYNRQLDGDR